MPLRFLPLRESVLIVAAMLAAATCTRAEPATNVSESGRRFFEEGLTTLATALAGLDAALASSAKPDPAPDAFRAARRAYKQVEAPLMYFVPIQTAIINSPRSEADDDLPNAPPRSAPIGFQVIEAALFDGSITRDSARLEMVRMRRVLDDLRLVTRNNPVDEAVLFDAARLQLARVAVLGLAGFDSDPSGDGVVEAAEALDGVRRLVGAIADSGATRPVSALLSAAAADLRANPDFKTYDRLRFIAAFANPIGEKLVALQQQFGPLPPAQRRLWRETAGTPFVADAFDATTFAPAHARKSTPALVALGERMFFDPRLSGPGTRACSSCHVPEMVFTDGRARAATLPGHTGPLRNTPSLLNAAFEPALFAEGRSRSLETQVGVVLQSAAEMSSSVDTVARRLAADSGYRAAFAAAMPERRDSAVTGLEVRQALAAYLRSLTALDSRFDRAVRGDTSALTHAERRGFTVYMGKAKCGTCHFVPLFNGVVPPDYRTAEAEVIGVPASPDLRRAVIDPDVGKTEVEDVPLNRFAFKVPTLRNIMLTAPYMHNGVFTTMEDVLEFYERGGGAGIGIDLPNQTLPATRLGLTPAERRDLIAFLGSLTDTTPLRRPIPAIAGR